MDGTCIGLDEHFGLTNLAGGGLRAVVVGVRLIGYLEGALNSSNGESIPKLRVWLQKACRMHDADFQSNLVDVKLWVSPEDYLRGKSISNPQKSYCWVDGFPFPQGGICYVMLVPWKIVVPQQALFRCHGNPSVRNWMWINALLIEWMVLFGHYLGFFSVGCWCLDFLQTWEDVGRCEKGGFLDRCYLLSFFFGFWLLHL